MAELKITWAPQPVATQIKELVTEPCVVVFGAQWVPTSKLVAETWQKKEEKKKTPIIYVDADKTPELCEQYTITTLPTVLRLNKGTEKARYIGKRTL